ncbi:hypothetical protein HJA72_003706, partial [Vibrio fluvialis]|nr:hypothetical protein [Vibrio fluvialis]
WRFDSTNPISDGAHQYEATAVDAAGNSRTESYQFTVDTVAPTIQVNIQDSNLENGKLHTVDDTPTFFGDSEADSTVTLTVDGGIIQTVQVDNNGQWSINIDTPLPIGEHFYEIKATDPANNSHIINQDFTVDDPNLISIPTP